MAMANKCIFEIVKVAIAIVNDTDGRCISVFNKFHQGLWLQASHDWRQFFAVQVFA